MVRSVFLILGAFTLLAQAQAPTQPAGSSDLAKILTFEADPTGTMPGGWSGTPPAAISVDDQVVHGGHWSVRLERRADSASNATILTKTPPLDFAGNTLVLRGFHRRHPRGPVVILYNRTDYPLTPVDRPFTAI